ncbi:uncharacterized protein E0L32_000810 [Thyridium curvatum]|uniref:Uncharacterized protein n=1 Tax=Thyridium curvatum TaxID=1093900 RepID=A0A507AYB4_9PEZI|nr:uncharacterized protein E0L32_000810 [Thyridium curvatum]TPX12633.1 hypothetical protein E0L32_000810 [Thyridium curvatum]
MRASASLVILSALAANLASPARASCGSACDTCSPVDEDVIERDVIVVGGGASGTYSAIRLQDLGASVVLIEKEGRLGGHQNTFIDPASGAAIDFGVQGFANTSVTTNFFARYDIPIEPFIFGADNTTYVDFDTGAVAANYTPNFNFSSYAAFLSRWPDAAPRGFSWIPYPVPEDLLLPFGEFIEKYGLQEQAWVIWWIANGVANPPFLQQTTLNIMKYFDSVFIDAVRYSGPGSGGVPDMTTSKHDNGALYAAAHNELGDDNVLLESTVVSGTRGAAGVELVVASPIGSVTRVRAKRLVLTIPPTPGNMEPFGLDAAERGVFGRFTHSAFYVGVVNTTGLRQGQKYRNIKLDGSVKYNVPQNGKYEILPTVVPGMFMYWFAYEAEQTQAAVEAEVAAVVSRLEQGKGRVVNFPAFASHSPFKMQVGAEDIAAGFYEDFLALQGQKSTWYAGSAILTHNSGELWNFTHHLMPDVVKGVLK